MMKHTQAAVLWLWLLWWSIHTGSCIVIAVMMKHIHRQLYCDYHDEAYTGSCIVIVVIMMKHTQAAVLWLWLWWSIHRQLYCDCGYHDEAHTQAAVLWLWLSWSSTHRQLYCDCGYHDQAHTGHSQRHIIQPNSSTFILNNGLNHVVNLFKVLSALTPTSSILTSFDPNLPLFSYVSVLCYTNLAFQP